jgi:toxin ParE1/3/4
VARFRFSRRAEADLLSIATYALKTWDEDQAARYIDHLEASCQTLTENPALGRSCGDVRNGLRRKEVGRHVVFYRQDAGGILVSRIPPPADATRDALLRRWRVWLGGVIKELSGL